MVSGTGDNIVYGSSGNDTFGWNSESLLGYDKVKDFNTRTDKLSFGDLVGDGESLESFFKDHVSDLTLNSRSRDINFNLVDGDSSKAIELHFSSIDRDFRDVAHDYNAASGSEQSDILANFLLSLTTA